MGRSVFYVVTHEEGWAVKREKAKAASYVFKTKNEALSKGRELAKKNQPSELRVQRQDGTFGDPSTYGSDPERSAG